MEKVGTTVVTLVVVLLVWYLRPLWHGFLMLLYKNPAVWESILLGFVVGIVIWRTSKNEETWWLPFVFCGIFLAGLLPLQLIYPQCYLAQHLKVVKITRLPEIDPDAVRIIPMEVSYRFAKDALQYARFKIGTPDIVFLKKKPHWSFGLVPDGTVNYFVLKDKGAMYVDMSTFQKKSKIVEKEMQIGEGMGITDWYKWVLYKQWFWVDYEDPYFVHHKNELYIAVPIIFYDYHWRFPTFFTIPKWAGTALIHSDGQVEWLTPKESLKHPVLKDQKLFPEKLTRYYINSFRYNRGIINRFFYHEDQIEIADLPAGIGGIPHQNEQPYLVVTKEGMKWVVACEPYGEAYGVFKIYLIDARTGKINVYELPPTEALLGPVSACDYVRKSNPIIDWNRMIPAEPIPVFRESKLYWEVRVIPKDASGVSYIAMVDAKTADVIELKTDQDVRRFLRGEYVEKSELPEKKKVRAVIILRDQNGGEIQRIEVLENQSFEVTFQAPKK